MNYKDLDKSSLSPMMQRYYETKAEYEDAILMYRLGDFYEMFFEDAEKASRELELTLTGRDCGSGKRAPMCGVPYHAVDGYIARLVSRGYKVAICEQLSTVPAPGKDIVDRSVVRVVTAGTVIDESMVKDERSNYLVSLYISDHDVGYAWADITTGEFNLYEQTADDVAAAIDDFLSTVMPSEIIANAAGCEYNQKVSSLVCGKFPKMQAYYDWAFKYKNAYDSLLKTLKVATLDSFEVTDKKFAVAAAGALNEYLHETQKRELPQFTKLSYYNVKKYMVLDGAARRNLELVETSRDRKKQGSLFWIIDKTSTAMGLRRLRKWLDYPSLEEKVINDRLDAVEFLTQHDEERAALKNVLSEIWDIERIAGRCAYGNVTPSDMLQLANTLTLCPELKKQIGASSGGLLKRIATALPAKYPVADELLKALDPDHCGAEYKHGGFIKAGYNRELDTCRSAKTEGKEWLASLEQTEKETTGIKTLHIGYNKVFGYYIEVSKANLSLVPFRYQRKQTLVNGERFITEELKTMEERLLTAESRALEIEIETFESFKKLLLNEVASLLKIASAVAELDALLSLAEVAVEYNYVRPKIGKAVKHIKIENGRHPVVEKIVGARNYIANDTLLDDGCKTMIITGPNMSGKSTYMRQVALITLLAHIGSFVPASSAEISLTDRIFTRIGASDDLAYSQSTFMVEMVEVATILNNATQNSLLILDEIGRGTSTYDGLGIAWAVMETIVKKLKAKTLFATHYHELTDLESRLPGVKNYRVLANEVGGSVVFLHKIARGEASKSFGAEVAALAGVSADVVTRAKDITKILEETSKYRDTNQILMQGEVKKVDVVQGNMFESQSNEKYQKLVEELTAIDMNSISPMQAFSILADLVSRVK
ncbi:MAG TPA: DNA mismatch repair protein MutS [Clostridiales bacterium]|nr:DNA mismatch repair protein MutS [Clostridiales bacterium]